MVILPWLFCFSVLNQTSLCLFSIVGSTLVNITPACDVPVGSFTYLEMEMKGCVVIWFWFSFFFFLFQCPLLVKLHLSHVFFFFFQFCMDTVKKFCHTGNHALILRAGNTILLKQFIPVFGWIMLMNNFSLTKWDFCLSSYMKWRCLWDITAVVLPAWVSARRLSIFCSHLSLICVCWGNLMRSSTCFSTTRDWWVWLLVLICFYRM